MKRLLATLLLCLALVGCTTTPTAPTDRQQTIANAIEDVISIGLVPVLSKNPAYLTEAQVLANGLTLVVKGVELTPANSELLLSKIQMTPEDRRIVAGLLNAAWTTYQKRYAEQVSKSIRPDVSLFLAAVSNGINNAVAATPK